MAKRKTGGMERTLQLIKAICTRIQDKEGYINKTKLIKLLYLIDIEYYRNHGETFTDFNWIFYDYGPWAYEYNKVYEQMIKSPDFTLKEGTRIDIDTQFIATKDRKEFEEVFSKIGDQANVRAIVDRWALEPLNTLLNYVYFYTEPMVDGKKGRSLDFSKINTLEPIPKFQVSKGTLTKEQIRELRKKIYTRIEEYRKTKSTELVFTSPNYDDVYLTEIEKLNRDTEY